jgi:hypothetical protein
VARREPRHAVEREPAGGHHLPPVFLFASSDNDEAALTVEGDL